MRKPVFTDFLDKPGQYTPVTKEPIRTGPVQGPQKPTTADVIAPKLTAQDREKYAKRREAAKAKKTFKTVFIGKDSYDYEFTGWDTLTPAQKQKALADARADIIANDPDADKKAPNAYDPGERVTEGSGLKAVANQVLGTAPGVQASNALANSPAGEFASNKVRNFAKSIEVKVPESSVYDREGLQMLADLTVNAPSQTVTAAADFLDKKTDNIGRVTSGLQVGATVLGAGQAAKAGKTAYDLARKSGASSFKAFVQGAGAAVGDNIGIDTTPPKPASFEEFAKAGGVDGVPRVGAQNASDVSGVVPSFRQPIAKMPELRLESLSPQGRALESWAGSNLQKLLDNGVGSDLRIWDAVGKHYGAGAVPRNADDFNLWVNDLVRSVDDNDRTVSAMAESYGRGGDLNADLVALREARGKARLNTQLRGGTNMVALIPQGRGYNVSKNSAWVPLESIPMHLRRSVMDRVGSSETRFTSRANYQAWVDAGKPEGGVLRPRMADEYMMDSFGGDSTLDDFILNPPKEAMVPQWAISAEIKNLSSRYTEAGKAAAAMRKPVRPQDFDDAVKHYNLESVPAPVEVPVAPKPVQVSKTKQVPQPETMPKRPAPPTTPAPVDVPTTSARKAQVADDRTDMGLGELEAPVRKSFGKSLDNAKAKGYDGAWASREAESVISKPRALDDEETAGMVDAMARLKNDHKSLLKQAENATDPAELSRINEGLKGIESQFDSISTAVRKSGTEKGRALASQKITINEDFDLISVRSRARANKGGELTAKEDAELVKRVNDLEAENVSYSAKIKELTEELTKALSVNTARRRTGGFSKEQTSARRVQAKTRFEEAKKKAGNVIGLNALAGKYLDPDVVKAFKEYVNATIDDGARTLDDVIKKMADEGVEADYEDVYTALTAKTGLRKLSDIQKEIALARKELAKEAKSKTVQTVEISPAEKRARAKVAELDAKIKAGDYLEAQPKKLREVDAEVYRLRAIRKMKQDRIRAVVESARPLSGAEKVGTVLTELKMLNPFARLTDLAANTSNLVSTVVETPARYAVDKLVGKVTKNDPLIKWNYETRERLARVMDNVKKTRGIELQRVLTGTDKASMEKFGKSRGPGGKLAGATDVPFRVVYREFGQDLFADAKARKLLPNGTNAEIANMRESILRSIDEHPDIIDSAEEYSLYKTFNNDNLVSKSFSKVRNGVIKSEAGKVLFDETIARFSRVITNVGQDAFDRTPYGLVANGLKLAVKRGSLTDVQRLVITDRLAKGMYGSAFMALGYYLGDKINVEFKGDKNKYADFGDLEKLGGLPGVFLYGVASRQSEKLKPDQTDMFKRQQATNLLTNSPAASNVQDMLGSLMQPGTNKVEQFAAKKITNMVIPSFFRDVASRMDSPTYGLTEGATRREELPHEYNESTERMRQTRNFWLILMKEAQSKVPVLRQQLPEKK